MYRLTINHTEAERILTVYFDITYLHFPLVKKINDINFVVVEYFSKYKDNESDHIEFEVISTPSTNHIKDRFEAEEFVTIEFDTEEEELYFKLKYCL